ncbi:MAG TPA: hypothetical protein VNW92_10165, partial [Polyangiaceae bacterium]|nr:hypothetical protein [Polyangiaceae bacterium]
MKFARLVSGLGIFSLFAVAGCGHSAESAAPAASPSSDAVTSAPALDEEAVPPPAAAPAPQGLAQPKSAESAREDDFSTLEAAEHALNQAKSELDRLAMAEPAPAPARSAADRAEKKDARPSAPSAAGAGAPATASAAPSGQCENACRAFASLTRAASA